MNWRTSGINLSEFWNNWNWAEIEKSHKNTVQLSVFVFSGWLNRATWVHRSDCARVFSIHDCQKAKQLGSGIPGDEPLFANAHKNAMLWLFNHDLVKRSLDAKNPNTHIYSIASAESSCFYCSFLLVHVWPEHVPRADVGSDLDVRRGVHVDAWYRPDADGTSRRTDRPQRRPNQHQRTGCEVSLLLTHGVHLGSFTLRGGSRILTKCRDWKFFSVERTIRIFKTLVCFSCFQGHSCSLGLTSVKQTTMLISAQRHCTRTTDAPSVWRYGTTRTVRASVHCESPYLPTLTASGKPNLPRYPVRVEDFAFFGIHVVLSIIWPTDLTTRKSHTCCALCFQTRSSRARTEHGSCSQCLSPATSRVTSSSRASGATSGLSATLLLMTSQWLMGSVPTHPRSWVLPFSLLRLWAYLSAPLEFPLYLVDSPSYECSTTDNVVTSSDVLSWLHQKEFCKLFALSGRPGVLHM